MQTKKCKNMKIDTLQDAKKALKTIKKKQSELKQLSSFIIKQINESGLRYSFLAEKLNISNSAFTQRMKNERFSVSELEILVEILK